MVVRVAANGVACLRELEKCLAPVGRHTRTLAGEARRGREKGGGECQLVEYRKGAFELLSITVVEGQQRGGARGQLRAVQPFCELRHRKDGGPTLRESGHPGGEPLTTSNPGITSEGHSARPEIP